MIRDCDDFLNVKTGLKEFVIVKSHSSVVKTKNYEKNYEKKNKQFVDATFGVGALPVWEILYPPLEMITS